MTPANPHATKFFCAIACPIFVLSFAGLLDAEVFYNALCGAHVSTGVLSGTDEGDKFDTKFLKEQAGMDKKRKDTVFMNVLAVDRTQSEAARNGGVQWMKLAITRTLSALQPSLSREATVDLTESEVKSSTSSLLHRLMIS